MSITDRPQSRHAVAPVAPAEPPPQAGVVGFDDVPALPTLAPIGWGLFVGSFMFGVGMQLGGSCASGTLFAIGTGHTAILLTLAGFVGGATLGAYQFPWWMGLPSHEPVSFADWFGGYAGAWAFSLAVMGLVVGTTYLLARNRSVPPLEPAPIARGVARAIRGSWPLWVGAILLAVL